MTTNQPTRTLSTTVVDESIMVTVVEAEPQTQLTAQLPIRADRTVTESELVDLTLGSPGDTRLTADGGQLIATRTLIRPEPGGVEDAAAGLAKLLVLAADRLRQLDMIMSWRENEHETEQPAFLHDPAIDEIIDTTELFPDPQDGAPA